MLSISLVLFYTVPKSLAMVVSLFVFAFLLFMWWHAVYLSRSFLHSAKIAGHGCLPVRVCFLALHVVACCLSLSFFSTQCQNRWPWLSPCSCLLSCSSCGGMLSISLVLFYTVPKSLAMVV